jgi:hypothetical protein
MEVVFGLMLLGVLGNLKALSNMINTSTRRG